MDKRFLFGVIVVMGMLLSGCSTRAEALPAADSPTDTEAVPTPAPEAGECLACHTDKERLIDTAKPEEEAGEGESKGVG